MKIGVVSFRLLQELSRQRANDGLAAAVRVMKLSATFTKRKRLSSIPADLLSRPRRKRSIRILEMAEYKNENCRKLIVAGCLAQRYKADLEAEMPEVDCFLTISDYPKMGQILTQVLGEKVLDGYGKTPGWFRPSRGQLI